MSTISASIRETLYSRDESCERAAKELVIAFYAIAPLLGTEWELAFERAIGASTVTNAQAYVAWRDWYNTHVAELVFGHSDFNHRAFARPEHQIQHHIAAEEAKCRLVGDQLIACFQKAA
jgi:hypothetical protein